MSLEQIEEVKEVLNTFTQSEAGQKLMADLGESEKYLLITYREWGIARDFGFLCSHGWRCGLHVPSRERIESGTHFTEGDEALQEIAEVLLNPEVDQLVSVEKLEEWLKCLATERDGYPLGQFPPLGLEAQDGIFSAHLPVSWHQKVQPATNTTRREVGMDIPLAQRRYAALLHLSPIISLILLWPLYFLVDNSVIQVHLALLGILLGVTVFGHVFPYKGEGASNSIWGPNNLEGPWFIKRHHEIVNSIALIGFVLWLFFLNLSGLILVFFGPSTETYGTSFWVLLGYLAYEGYSAWGAYRGKV